MKERIKDVQKRHIDNVRTMYEWQAQDYYDEMLDLARSKPGISDPDVEVWLLRFDRPSVGGGPTCK